VSDPDRYRGRYAVECGINLFNHWRGTATRFFATISREAIRRGSCGSVKELIAAIGWFIDGWNECCPRLSGLSPQIRYSITAGRVDEYRLRVRMPETRPTSLTCCFLAGRVGARNLCTSCDLPIFVKQAADPVAPPNVW
jgi:hypothetical protein